MANRNPRVVRRRLFGMFALSILVCVGLHIRLFSDHVTLSVITDTSKFRYNELFLSPDENETARQPSIVRCVPDLFPGHEKLSVDDLQDYPVPNVVHYVWCHNRTLKFENYLSILSAWKILRPDSIELHYLNEINSENEKYDMWLQDLRKTIPGLLVKKMPPNWDGQEKGCGPQFGMAVLLDRGGIYLSETVILLKPIREYRQQNFSFAMNKHAKISFIFSVAKNRELRQLSHMDDIEDVSIDSFDNTTICDVVTAHKLDTSTEDTVCSEVSNLFPVDIMYSETNVAKVARRLFYGDESVVQTKPVLPGKIPKIVHLVWFKRKEMTFMMYLSMRSALTILNPEKVFIYGDKLLFGDYLDKILRDPRVKMIYREMPRHIYGNDVLFTQHRSDIIRADVLLKYGGIYMDWDVLWLKPIDDLLNEGHDAVVNFDHISRRPYPDAINLGVLLAKPNSHFVKYWQDSLLHYKSRDFYHNALELPYKTYEKYPHYVKIERHLQVMCYLLKCHPTFRNGYKSVDTQQYFNWRNETYAIHFTHPDPPAFASEKKLNESHDRFSEMGKFILQQKFEYD